MARSILFWLLCGIPLLAQDQAFFIETIQVKGARSESLSVLRSALQLEEGRTYTEADFQGAIYRLEGLPFILDADAELRRGSRRDAYSLVFTVTETRRYFWVLFVDLSYVADDYLADEEVAQVDPDTGASLSGLAFGRRWFPGRNGELTVFFPFTPGISYTHYNVFNRGVIASVAAQFPGGTGKNFSSFPENGRLTRLEDTGSTQLTFSMARRVTQHQWLNFNYKLNFGNIDGTVSLGMPRVEHLGTNFRNHRSELVWRYDSKDHPLFPTSGTLLSSGLLLDREYRDAANDDPNVFYDTLEANKFLARFRAERYWPDRGNDSYSLFFEVGASKTKYDARDQLDNLLQEGQYNSTAFELGGKYARNMLDKPFWGKPRDFRFEAEVGFEKLSSTLPDIYYPDPDFYRVRAGLSLVARDNFGLVKFSMYVRDINVELWQ